MSIVNKTYNPGQYSNPIGIAFDGDSMTVSEDQAYKNTPLMSLLSEYHQGNAEMPEETWSHYYISETVIRPAPINGRFALYFISDNNISSVAATPSVSPYTATVYFDIKTINEYEGVQRETWSYNRVSLGLSFGGDNIRDGATVLSTNIPVFATAAEAWAYINAEREDTAILLLRGALNFKSNDYNPEETKTWTYSCFHSEVDLVRGTTTPTNEIGFRTLKFQSNSKPAFYLNEGSFEMNLIAQNVIASVYAAGPESVIDNMPESQWVENELAYNGPFYCPLSIYIEAFDETPGDGSYIYPTQFQTNIDIYASKEDAEEAIETGDNSKAIRRGPSKDYDIPIGSEEEETEFGGGGFMSPFFTILSGSKNDIHRLAEVLFTDDGNLWDDIKRGLELYGSNPIDYVIDIKAFGFNLANVTTQSTRSDVWFGSYRHHFEDAFNEIINLSAKYIDAGSFFMRPIQYCYLDFAPFTTVSLYIPYHGWEEIDFKKYYNKQVNCRYYVDVLTGQALFVTLCDGILCDQFGPFEIGTELPLTGTNFSQWAQGQVRLLTQAAQSLVGGIAGGATSGNVAGFASGSLQSLIPATQALQTAKQQGGVRNTMITKGNFTAQIGNYMPGYVFFRFDIHEMLEPTLLQSLVGRPAYASGNVRDFSGFIQGDVVKLDTSGMSDEEASQIISLLQNGIYV